MAVIRVYEPLMPAEVGAFAGPLDVFEAIDVELSLMPEYYYSYFTEDTTFACPYGGAFTFGPSDAGETYSFSDYEFTNGFAITGTGSFDYNSGVFYLDTQVSGDTSGTLTYTNNYRTGSVELTGEYGGENIDLSR